MADFNDLNNLNATPDYTSSFDPADVQANKVMGVLAYLSWLVLIPLFAARNSPFARFHCNQGIVLALAEVLAGVILGIGRRLPLIGWVFRLVGGLASIAWIVLAVIGILNALNGRAKELPLIGGINILG